MTKLRDVTVGQLIAAILRTLVCVFVFFSMWMGEVTFLVVLVEHFHLHYNATGIPGVDRLAGNFLLTMPPLIPAGIVAAIVWQHILVDE